MSTKGPSTTSVVAIGASVVAFTAWTIAVQAGALDGLDEQTLFGGLGPNSAVAQIVTAFALLTWPGVIYAILFGVGFWARQRRLLNLGTSMWLAILFGWGGHLAWKFLLGRQRPDQAYDAITAIGPAYPSGHVVAITIVGCMGVAASIVTRQSRRFQNWVRVGVLALLVLVLLDRWLLVAHWASDLVGGVLWGAVAASVSLVLARVHVLPVGHSTTGEDQRCAIIYNPTKIDDLMTFRRHVTFELKSHGWQPPIWLETTPDDPGHDMAKRALDLDVDLVMAAGGDGTVRVVCEELADTGMPFAVIPAGTGNLLARNLNIPLDEQAALIVALEGRPTPTDLVEITADGEKRYVSGVMAGLGIDAVIMDRTDSDLKKAVGSAAYFVAAAQNVDHPPLPVRITVDDRDPITREAMLVMVGNVGMLQGGIQIIPDAKADDGYLDLLVASPESTADLLRMTRKVLTRVAEDEHLEHTRARSVRIEADRTEQFQLDGDTEGEASVLEARVMPGALQLMLPR